MGVQERTESVELPVDEAAVARLLEACERAGNVAPCVLRERLARASRVALPTPAKG